jgi:inhibitor of cysteine peptidase
MKTIKIIPVLLLFVLSQCALFNSNENEMETDKTFEAKKGEEIIIKLDANPSTGYNWSIANEIDNSVIELVKESYKPDKVPEGKNIVGSGGTKIFVFKGLKKGNAYVRLEYKRPGMPKPEKEKVFLLKVK